MSGFVDTLEEEYKEYINICEEVEALLNTEYPPLTQSHVIAYVNNVNILTSKISDGARDLGFLLIVKNRELRAREGVIRDLTPHADRRTVSMDSVYSDIDTEVAVLTAIRGSLDSCAWNLKSAKDFLIKIYDSYTSR